MIKQWLDNPQNRLTALIFAIGGVLVAQAYFPEALRLWWFLLGCILAFFVQTLAPLIVATIAEEEEARRHSRTSYSWEDFGFHSVDDLAVERVRLRSSTTPADTVEDLFTPSAHNVLKEYYDVISQIHKVSVEGRAQTAANLREMQGKFHRSANDVVKIGHMEIAFVAATPGSNKVVISRSGVEKHQLSVKAKSPGSLGTPLHAANMATMH